MTPDRDAPDFDAMAREWLDNARDSKVRLDWFATEAAIRKAAKSFTPSLSALLRQTYERGVRDEREACALVARNYVHDKHPWSKDEYNGVAAAIRARTP